MATVPFAEIYETNIEEYRHALIRDMRKIITKWGAPTKPVKFLFLGDKIISGGRADLFILHPDKEWLQEKKYTEDNAEGTLMMINVPGRNALLAVVTDLKGADRTEISRTLNFWLKKITVIDEDDYRDMLEKGDGGIADKESLWLKDTNAIEKAILKDVFKSTSMQWAIRLIYDNFLNHGKQSWQFIERDSQTNGNAFLKGTDRTGSALGFREALKSTFELFDRLRDMHPHAAIRNGTLQIKSVNTLLKQNIATKSGLLIMSSTALQGNVYLQLDGLGHQVRKGTDNIDTFVLKGHASLVVNGMLLDPVFEGINKDIVANKLNAKMRAGNHWYLLNTKEKSTGNAFSGEYLHVEGYNDVMKWCKTMEKTHQRNEASIAKLSKAHGKRTVTEEKLVQKMKVLWQEISPTGMHTILQLAVDNHQAKQEWLDIFDDWKTILTN